MGVVSLTIAVIYIYSVQEADKLQWSSNSLSEEERRELTIIEARRDLAESKSVSEPNVSVRCVQLVLVYSRYVCCERALNGVE